jgi:PTH1 family peptidyl-tRNA hydrolase
MSYIFVGLGNPGGEYELTRHNTGRMILEWLAKSEGAEWKSDKKLSAQTAKIKIGKSPITLILPDTFMNNSGKSIKALVANSKAAEKMLVIYDDLDLPFGTAKMSFNKSSGGHRGYVSPAELENARQWRQDPEGWSARQTQN